MRRIFSGLLLAFFLIAPFPAQAVQGEHSAREAIEMFRKACLDHIGKPGGIEDYASDRMAELKGDTAASFLNAISPAAGGTVWGRKHGEGTSVIVSSPDGTCAVAAASADADTLFRETGLAAQNAARTLKGDLEPTPVLQAGVARKTTYKIVNPFELKKTVRITVTYDPATHYDALLEARVDP